GVGSVFTSGALVEGSIGLLWPILRNESALEPERVTEKLRQSSFWQGRGGSVEHTISGLDIALRSRWVGGRLDARIASTMNCW
ncbi:MAG: hypothetical protein NT069_29400, partial [Planctomycetota bacterium]|nr:hypothetical protein [Planctomycetota bacterium]